MSHSQSQGHWNPLAFGTQEISSYSSMAQALTPQKAVALRQAVV